MSATLAKPPSKFALTLPINAALQTTTSKFQYPYEFGIAGRGAYDYTWIYVLGCILCFTMASAVRWYHSVGRARPLLSRACN